MSKTCRYFFAPQSPWTYLGHDRFLDIARRHGAQIEMRPVDLGRVFGVSGGLPLAKRPPQRQAYRLKELARWSAFLGKPMHIQPKFFPVSGDPAARVIIAAQLAYGTDRALQLAGAIMRGLWEEEKNIADPATLGQFADACGLDGGMLLKSAETASVQAEYDRFTDEAIAAEVFGSPWYAVDGDGYWGQDRLDFVERALAR
ncbi:MAG: 2-hydroxychromene-2-carboxylate isomerase [Burkholderiaceae bacterium]